MRSSELWLLCLALWALTKADVVFKKAVGAELIVGFPHQNLSLKILCKNPCREQDFLLWTWESRQRNGRYSLTSEKKGSPPVDTVTVTFSNLALSDSGGYRFICRGPVQSYHSDFIVEVMEAPSTGDPWTVSPSGTPNEKPEGSPAPGLLIQIIAAILSCAGLITITVTILIVCKKRVWGMRSGGPNMEHDYENIPQPSNRGEYQDLRLQNMDPPYSNLRWAVTARTAV